MLRKHFNEDDFQDEFFDDDGAEGEEIHYIGKTDLISSIQDMEMFEMNYHSDILDMSIKMAKDSFFWKFKSAEKKIKTIKEIFNSLNKILLNANLEEK